MNIISEREKNGRMQDGINSILNLSEENFNLLIKKLDPKDKISLEKLRFFYLTDDYENSNSPIQLGLEEEPERGYYGGTSFSMQQILSECTNILSNFPEDSLEYSRITQLINSRNLESFKTFYLARDRYASPILDKVFEILSDEDLLSKFLDYDNNSQLFTINGKEVNRSEYLKCLGKIFGCLDKNGNLATDNHISSNFFIPNIEQLKQNYLKLYDEVNMDRYVNPEYTFSSSLIKYSSSTIVNEYDEPNWTISPEIYESVLGTMPKDLSLEEQAMYIYCKLCSISSYDEGYLYKDKLKKINYSSTFSKEHLESLKPNSKITCYDFARLYMKLLNSLDGDITAVMILKGLNEGHALCGFYTDKVSVTAEAINFLSKTDLTNDLSKAKSGIKLCGINIISDKKGIIPKAIDTVYPKALGTQPKTIKEYIQDLNNIPKNSNIPNDVTLKLESLLKVMKSKFIFGNEFVQLFWGICKSSHFGDVQFEKAYLGELSKAPNGIERYKRHILLRELKSDKNNDTNPLDQLYIINTDSLELTCCSSKEIIDKFKSGKYIYENENHKLTGIDLDVSK